MQRVGRPPRRSCSLRSCACEAGVGSQCGGARSGWRETRKPTRSRRELHIYIHIYIYTTSTYIRISEHGNPRVCAWYVYAEHLQDRIFGFGLSSDRFVHVFQKSSHRESDLGDMRIAGIADGARSETFPRHGQSCCAVFAHTSFVTR